MLKNKGLDIPVRHIANSAAIMMYPETHLEMVRAGIILYGFYPSEDVDKTRKLPLSARIDFEIKNNTYEKLN